VKCWKEGEKTDGGGVVPDASPRPDAPPRLRPFVGTWDFISGTVSTMCSDGSKDTRPLAGDFMDVDVSPDSDIIASFYCDWHLNVVGGSTTLSRPAQTCMTTSMGTVFTWTVATFEFATSDGQSGTLNSRIGAAYNNSGMLGTCTLTIAGALTHAP
jgi:hypothetical protein